ncbi:MAG TPA: helix-turn-helix domain-containing protein [Kofleriaceae bacterium]|nr:helix-turn-helix domain-containing protein [Kofleriaceae bacterium]
MTDVIDMRALARRLVDAARMDPEVRHTLGELRGLFGESDAPPCEKVEDCAKRLNLHPSTIYRAVDAGELECVEVGDTIRIPITATRPRRRKRAPSATTRNDQLSRAELRLLGRHGDERHLGGDQHDRHGLGDRQRDGNGRRQS